MQTSIDHWLARTGVEENETCPAITPTEMLEGPAGQTQQGARRHDISDGISLKRCSLAKVDSSRKTAKLSQDAIATDNRECDLAARQFQDEQLARALNAQFLQEQDDDERARREANMLQQQEMLHHPAGKAYHLVELLTKTIRQILHKTKLTFDVEMVALDDMYFLAEKFTTTQEKFQAEKKSFEMTVGYHYTSEHNIGRIRTDGLLNRNEREQRGIKDSGFNGANYGEGIYTGDEPISFCSYGEAGLLVARLPGTAMEARDAKGGYTMGNDSITSKSRKLLVLKESCQCLATVKFRRAIMYEKEGERVIARIHLSVQKLIDYICTPRQAKMYVAAEIDHEIPVEVSDAEVDSLLQTWPKPLHTGDAPKPPIGISGQAPVPVSQTVIIPSSQAQNVATTSLASAAQSSSSPDPSTIANGTATSTRKQKERFLIFTRVLMKYLEQKDPQLHVEVKNVIRDSASRNSRKEPGYESVTSAMERRLKAIVNDHYWKRAEVYLDHFLKQKSLTSRPSAESSQMGVCFRFVRSNIQMDVSFAEMRVPITCSEIYDAGVRKAKQLANGMFLVGNQDEIKSLRGNMSQVMIQVNSDGPRFTKSEFLALKSDFFDPFLKKKKTPPVVQLILTIEETKPMLKAEDSNSPKITPKGSSS